jgi:hypothetical protein
MEETGGEVERKMHESPVWGRKAVSRKGSGGDLVSDVHGILGLAIASSARPFALRGKTKHSDYQVHTACKGPRMDSVGAIFGIDLSTALASVYRQYSRKRPVHEFPINELCLGLMGVAPARIIGEVEGS